ncbi:hypothetical protein [Actinomyces sp.]|uniref:hypothetical protein n=1 Tax=Actinomyces sp. TaxID=29317 RepID=UPI0026DBD2B9|nr:hypothetical protein [Actinomyces sp.]MDO4899263.1 hypothetical protein [Actinomyces sp.]
MTARPSFDNPGVRLANSRLRVGAFTAAGDAVTLTQCDTTTCGATAILAARLLLGAPIDAAMARQDVDARPALALRDSLAVYQRQLQRSMNRHAGGPLGLLPWTRRLGSTPWAVAAELTRTLTETGLTAGASGVVWVDDRGAQWEAVVAELRCVLAAGAPVILLTGAPLRVRRDGAGRVHRALQSMFANAPAIPRHYVLALPWELVGRPDPGPGRAHLYEPSSGTVKVLDLLAARPPAGPGPRELGGWPRVLAVIAPRPPSPTET